MQRFVDAWMSFPGLLLLLTIITIVGQGIPQIIVVLGVTSGIGNSRVIRSAVIGIKENPYFEAARAIGSAPWHILKRHVWPNITAPVIVVFSITIGGIIIAEASLSFLGFGLPTTVPSWGGMLSREGRQFMEMAPRLAMWPGVALTVVVYCLNMFGDAVRDLLDPRLRGGGGGAGLGSGGMSARAIEGARRALQKSRPLRLTRRAGSRTGVHGRRDRIVRGQNRGGRTEGNGHQQAVERVTVMGEQLRGAINVVSRQRQAIEFPAGSLPLDPLPRRIGQNDLAGGPLSVISSADTSLNSTAESAASIACCAAADRRSGSEANQIRVQVSSR